MEAGASRGCNPVFVITLDQFGVCWAPSASARAWLTEALSLVKVTIPVHAKDGSLQFVTQDELSPASPAISLASAAAEQFSSSSPSSLLSSSSSSYSSSSSSVSVLHPEIIQDGFGTPPRLDYLELSSQAPPKQHQHQQQQKQQQPIKQQQKRQSNSSLTVNAAVAKPSAAMKATEPIKKATSKPFNTVNKSDLLNAVKKVEKMDGMRAYKAIT